MQCPKCSGQLQIGERKNIEIDYCPSCRGIWLDAGELDKIIERSQNNSNREYHHEEEKESWWERIVDIFD